MTALYVIATVALFLFLLLALPADLILTCRDELTLTLRVLFLRFPLVPKKEKPPKLSHFTAEGYRRQVANDTKEAAEKQKKADDKAAKKAAQKGADAPGEKRSLSALLDKVGGIKNIAVRVIERFARRLTIRVRRCDISIGTGDAASTALATGAVNAALYGLAEVLRNTSGLDDESAGKLYASPDFLGEGFHTDLDILFRIRVFGVFDVAFTALKAFLKEKKRIMPAKSGKDADDTKHTNQEKEQTNG